MLFSSTKRSDILKDYGFLSFAKNMGKSIGQTISKNLSSKYSQKRLDQVKQSATDELKTALKRVTQKTAEATPPPPPPPPPPPITKVRNK